MADIEQVKISQLEDIGNSLSGFYTIGYKEVGGVKQSRKADLGFVEAAATNANDKATAANAAAQQANAAAGEAHTAAQNANNKATLANTAAGTANTAATNADNKATLANNAATNANDKATLANDKATLADQKATLADQKATYAQQQGDYAKGEGDRSKNFNDHPSYIGNGSNGDLNYWYIWDYTAQQYVRSSYAKGDDLHWEEMSASEKQALANEVLVAVSDFGLSVVDGKLCMTYNV